jgi:cytochrome c oxidase subunit 1
MYALKSVVSALAAGLIAFYIGLGFAVVMRYAFGYSAWNTEMCITVAWVFGVVGWLFGIGMWGNWVREWIGLETYGRKAPGWQRYFTFNHDHKVIGIQYIVTFAVVFLLAGLLAMLIRVQLMQPTGGIFSNSQYNAVMTMHGIMMISVAVAAVIGGFGNYAVPLLIGADDMAFPRLNALSYWLIPPVAVTLLATPLLGGLDHGWTAYPPLSSAYTSSAQVLFDLAIITFGLTSIISALNFLVTIMFMRAPGMTWGRLPIFVWSMFVTAWLALLYTQGFAIALLMVLLDRVAGMSFFEAKTGGDPLLYQHVFWFYSHPAVYIMVLPGLGLALEVISHFSRKPLFAYRYAVGGFLGILGLSGVVWAHHMFTSGMANYLQAPILVTTELISIPTGLIFLSALGTIWMGKLWLRTPMLFALAVIFNFANGGVTGIFLADVPTDIHLHDTYFVVAHFHYTIVGGEIFALFAGIYYWFPKMTGRMYDERLAKIHFWWMFIGFNLTFFTMYWPGIQGMNRRIAEYPDVLQPVNIVVSIAAFAMGASFLVFVYNMLNSWIRGPVAESNPWAARTLEWQTTSPPPVENFPVPPVIKGHPYDYGVPGSVHATFPGLAGSPAGGGSGSGGGGQ